MLESSQSIFDKTSAKYVLFGSVLGGYWILKLHKAFTGIILTREVLIRCIIYSQLNTITRTLHNKVA